MDGETMDSTSMKEDERRVFPRLDARVKVNLIFMPPGSQEAISREFRSMDVSTGGIRIEIDSDVAVGSFVALRIKLPEEKESVDLFAKVVWRKMAKRDDDGSFYVVGLQFLSSSEESAEILKGFLRPRLE